MIEDEFLLTKEYKRFEEFANACAQYRYIGLCYGVPGVGKTISAHYYAAYHLVHEYDRLQVINTKTQQQLVNCKAVFHTVEITNTPKRLWSNLYNKMQLLGTALLQAQGETDITQIAVKAIQTCPLVIIDEADRLNMSTLEQLRAIYDRYGFGLVLIGMPGIEKRLMRYAQLYSRIGFAHEFRQLGGKDLQMVIEKFCQLFKLQFSDNAYLREQTIQTIATITRGNFRLTQRLFGQMQRIQQINQLKVVDKKVVEAARNLLIIGHEG